MISLKQFSSTVALTALIVFSCALVSRNNSVLSESENNINLADEKIINELENNAYENFYQSPADLIAKTSDVVQESKEVNLQTKSKSFYIKANKKIVWEKLGIVVTFEDNSKSQILKVEPSDEAYGKKAPTESRISQLFIFTKNIKSISLLGEENKNVTPIVSDQMDPSLQIGKASAATSAVKKEFYKNFGINLVTREDWGAPSLSPWTPEIVSPDTIVVHHTATSVNSSNPKATVKEIYDFHYYRCANNVGSFDPENPACNETSEIWGDIGYNYLIDPQGNIYEGRAGANGSIGAHSPPNYKTIGISLLGNFVSSEPTSKAKNSLAKLIALLSKLNDITPQWGVTIQGHRDRNVTACPGGKFYDGLSTIVNQAKNLLNINSNLNNVIDRTDKYLAEPNLLIKDGTKIQSLINTKNLTLSQKNYFKNKYPGVSNFKQRGDLMLFDMEEGYLEKNLREAQLLNLKSRAQPNLIYQKATWNNASSARAVPSDYDVTTHWNLEKIKTPEAWKDLEGCASNTLCGGSPSTVVAVIDSGVAYENFDFDAGSTYVRRNFSGYTIETPNGATNGTYNEGYDRRFYKSPELTNTNFTEDGYDAAWDYLCFFRSESPYPCNSQELAKIGHANDDDGHGTFVSTIIAGNTGDAAPNKLTGIAHNVTIMPIKAFIPNDSSFCEDAEGDNDPNCEQANDNYQLRVTSNSAILVASIEYAVDNGADVINMSLSGPGYDSALQDAVNYANINDVVVIAASGNNGANVNNYIPASLDNVIAVGSTNSNDARSSYSNYGTKLDLVAPVGESGIASRWFNCSVGYNLCFKEDANYFEVADFTSGTTPVTAAGTSFASPQVAAAAALLKSSKTNISPSEVETILESTARDVGATGFDNFTGNGVLNLELMINTPWTNWAEVRNGVGASGEVLGSKYVQGLRDAGKIYTRINNGSTWSSWEEGPSANQDPYLATTSDLLFQTAVNNGLLTTRIYDGNTWSSWVASGSTTRKVYMTALGDKMIQSIQASGFVWTRIHDGANWGVWVKNGGTSGDVYMEALGSNLVQSVQAGGYVWTRSYDGNNWSIWNKSGGTTGGVIMETFNNRIYQNVIAGGYLWMRSADISLNWTTWAKVKNSTKGPFMHVFGNTLYQSIQYNGVVFTRSRTTSSTSWGAWSSSGGTTGDVYFGSNTNKLFQSIQTNGTVWTRVLVGDNWSKWIENGGTTGDVKFNTFNNNVYQLVTAGNAFWTRNISVL